MKILKTDLERILAGIDNISARANNIVSNMSGVALEDSGVTNMSLADIEKSVISRKKAESNVKQPIKENYVEIESSPKEGRNRMIF